MLISGTNDAPTVKICDLVRRRARLCSSGISFVNLRYDATPLSPQGAAKIVGGASDSTCHITTLWYRAPEYLMGSSHCTLAADMWAVCQAPHNRLYSVTA